MRFETRKLGSTDKYHVCPDCGVREQDNQEQEGLIIKEVESEKRRNYEDCSEVIIEQYLQQNGTS